MKKTMLIGLLLLLIVSCNKALVEAPKEIVVSNFYNTPTEAATAIAAIFVDLRSGYVAATTFGGVYESIQEASCDWFLGRASYAAMSEGNGLDGSNITRVGNMWTLFYRCIRDANLVIKNVPHGSNLSSDQKAFYVGEAKFMRALIYFYLVRNWGAVPLRTDQNMDSISVPRDSLANVYALITSDLTYAANVLPEEAALPGLPTVGAAETVLADAYFYQGLYEDAAEESNKVIQSGQYSLVPVAKPGDFNNIFGPDAEGSPEEIFYLYYNQQQWWKYVQYLAGSDGLYVGISGFYVVSGRDNNPLYMNWSDSDFRKEYDFYSYPNSSLGSHALICKKYTDPGSSTPTNSYTMYRYADLLLIYAEASCEAAGKPTAEGMEALNMVHRRAYGYDPTKPSPVDFKLSDYDMQSFVDLVVRERGYETVGEGKRWLDLKRSGMAAEYIKNAWGVDLTQRALLWPIPTSEMEYNKDISASDQNPGY